ncbi:VOC family protein [Paucibacter soli]|uniref:VOC family protein n=1 Tax=Paucibacter soli TaxID=3133433 RepID=UPI0030B087D9
MSVANLQVLGLDHVVLRVRDLAASLAFYVDLLGCQLERRQDEIGLVQLRAGAALIDLLPLDGKLGRAGGGAAGEEGRNMDHFALRVGPFDEPSLRRALEAAGVAVGSYDQRYGAQGEGPSLYIRDPDGNGVELKATTLSEAQHHAA